ncbi:MAG: ComEC/Rec2 family competence protein [Proteobacteria bacterium]|nr:ComEC/Rec2 family competence protein [Pseudomonadota bacterium]
MIPLYHQNKLQSIIHILSHQMNLIPWRRGAQSFLCGIISWTLYAQLISTNITHLVPLFIAAILGHYFAQKTKGNRRSSVVVQQQILFFFICGFYYAYHSTYGVNSSSLPGQFSKVELEALNQNNHLFVMKVSLSGERAVLGIQELSGYNQNIRYILVKNRGCHPGYFDANRQGFAINAYGITCATTTNSLTLRTRLLKHMQNKLHVKDSHAGSWVYASLFGDRSFLDGRTKELLRHLGLIHLTAVSGFHLSMILAVLRLSFLFIALGKHLILTYSNLKIRWIGTKPSIWSQSMSLLWSVLPRVFEGLILLFWLFCVSFKPSATRAFACYLATFMCVKGVSPKKKLEDLITFSLLSFFMISPLDIFSFSSLLSMTAYGYLITIFYLFIPQKSDLSTSLPATMEPGLITKSKAQLSVIAKKSKNLIIKVKHYLQVMLLCQLGLQWFSFLMVGEMSWLGIICNIIVLPLLVLYLQLFLVTILGSQLLVMAQYGFLADYLIAMLLTLTNSTLALLSIAVEFAFTKFTLMAFRYQLSDNIQNFCQLLTIFCFATILGVWDTSSESHDNH